ncbi:MAG: DUF5683 domain-containing protein [Gemmatimonadota bacterium]
MRGLIYLGGALIVLSGAPLAGQVQPAEPAVGVEAEGPSVSPRGAFLRSLVLPGWGQAYVGAHGRGALYFTMATGTIWMTYVANRQLGDARKQQEFLRAAGEADLEEDTEFVEARARHLEDAVALSLFLMFFSGADAYVAAYLADFDERIGVRRGQDGSLRLQANIPLGTLR